MEDCIRKSIEQYHRIIEHTGRLEALLCRPDPDELQEYTRRLSLLQDEAGRHDRLWQERFAGDAGDRSHYPLLEERNRLLERIVKVNHALLPRIQGMMAVTTHELSQIRNGSTAVAGYQSGSGLQRPERGIG